MRRNTDLATSSKISAPLEKSTVEMWHPLIISFNSWVSQHPGQSIMKYRFLIRFQSQQFCSWVSGMILAFWSAKKYRSWTHFSGPIPISSVAVQRDLLRGSSGPRHCKRASRVTKGKGSGTQANWQAEGVVKNLVLPVQTLRGLQDSI